MNKKKPNEIIVSGDVATMILESKKHGRKEVIFDVSDIPLVAKYRWAYLLTTNNEGVTTNVDQGDGKKISVTMYRVIMGPEGDTIDHKNLNKLDNRRSNLRVATFAQNLCNKPPTKKSKLGIKGVCMQGKKFVAQIQSNRKTIHLGTFGDARSAAIAYNEAAIKYHGEFAWLNDISTIGESA